MDHCIAIDKLTKVYRTGVGTRTRTAVSSLDLEVPAGQIVGLLGPNGAGKTTTLKSIMGFIRPTSGRVTIFGRSARDSSVHRDVGFLPEQPYFPNHLRAEQALRFYGRLCGVRGQDINSRVAGLLELVGLSESAHMKLSKYSRGMLQRLGIAQALVNDPQLVVLDEPASGLDPIGQKEMRNLVLGLKQKGKTVFLSSHQLSEVEAVCDSVSILNRGTLRRQGTLDELLNVPQASTITVRGEPNQGGAVRTALANIADEIADMDDTYKVSLPTDRAYEALDVLAKQGMRLESVEPKRLSLEDYFIELVRGEGDGD